MSEKLVQHLVTIGIWLLLAGTLGPVTKRIAREAVQSCFNDSVSLGQWNRRLQNHR